MLLFSMRSYFVPPDIAEKEKVIGGLLDITQFFWLLSGVGLGALLFFATFTISLGLATFLGILALPIGIPFAFYKKQDLPLYEYLKLKRAFKKKTKKLPNLRRDVEF